MKEVTAKLVRALNIDGCRCVSLSNKEDGIDVVINFTQTERNKSGYFRIALGVNGLVGSSGCFEQSHRYCCRVELLVTVGLWVRDFASGPHLSKVFSIMQCVLLEYATHLGDEVY